LFKKHMASYCGEWQFVSVHSLWILNGRVSWVVIGRSQAGSSTKQYSGSVSCSESLHKKMNQKYMEYDSGHSEW
jgi:hypothetical protein